MCEQVVMGVRAVLKNAIKFDLVKEYFNIFQKEFNIIE